MLDVEKNLVLAEVPVGVEPEGMGLSPDGKVLVNTSETTNMAHFIDTTTHKIIDNVLVDARPRFAEFSKDGKSLWVSAEVGGTVSVIDPATRRIVKKITFKIPGVPDEAIQPVGIRITKDGARAFVALGPANRVAVINAKTYRNREVSSRRPARLAARLHAGREAPVHDERHLERRLGDRRPEPDGDEEHPGRALPVGRDDLAAIEPFKEGSQPCAAWSRASSP